MCTHVYSSYSSILMLMPLALIYFWRKLSYQTFLDTDFGRPASKVQIKHLARTEDLFLMKDIQRAILDHGPFVSSSTWARGEFSRTYHYLSINSLLKSGSIHDVRDCPKISTIGKFSRLSRRAAVSGGQEWSPKPPLEVLKKFWIPVF